MALINPGIGQRDLVSMEYHQQAAGALVRTPDWYPDKWDHPEFSEGQNAWGAREVVTVWLENSPVLLARAAKVLAGEPDPTTGTRALSYWLDDVLYGDAKFALPRDEWEHAQLAADAMERRHFCMMDFAAVAAAVRELANGS